MKIIKKETGQAAVEFAIVLPILLIIICGIIDFGWLFYNQLSLENCTRDAARYGAVNAANTDCVTLIDNKVNEDAVDSLKKIMTVNVTFSSPQTPCDGDITVTITSKIKVLTPVLGVFCKDQEKVLTCSVTMKAES